MSRDDLECAVVGVHTKKGPCRVRRLGVGPRIDGEPADGLLDRAARVGVGGHDLGSFERQGEVRCCGGGGGVARPGGCRHDPFGIVLSLNRVKQGWGRTPGVVEFQGIAGPAAGEGVAHGRGGVEAGLELGPVAEDVHSLVYSHPVNRQ